MDKYKEAWKLKPMEVMFSYGFLTISPLIGYQVLQIRNVKRVFFFFNSSTHRLHLPFKEERLLSSSSVLPVDLGRHW